jgi:N-terminal domain of anti-restriction factor ArdC
MPIENRRSEPNEEPAQPLVRETPQRTASAIELFDARTDKQRQVLDILQRGVEGILTSEGYQAYLQTMAKFHQYSFANTLLIHAQNPEATHVAGFRTWQAMNRQVRRGETSIKIFVPFKCKITDEETGAEEHRLTGFGVGSVFDLGQTDGEPLPEPPRVVESTEVNDVSREVNKRLSRYLIDEGLLLESKPFLGSARGFWNPGLRQIVIRQDKDVDPLSVQKTKTLAHEAAHFLAEHNGAGDHQDYEVVAESSAYVALSHFGLDTSNYTFSYVANWGRDMNRLRANLGQVQRISNQLISAIEGTQPGEMEPA